MTALYNEIEPYAADWIERLAQAQHIAAGHVDRRSIVELTPADCAPFTQCHFFAGIGGWSYALRLAGWPDDRPVWTGSCPCQPFSVAGKGGGITDERHLWPDWFRLIKVCRPEVIFGEQVSSPAGLAWLDAVFADLEGEGYACGAADLCAAGAGAPHLRQRLYFCAMADGYSEGRGIERAARQPHAAGTESAHGDNVDGRGEVCSVADDSRDGWRQGSEGSRGCGGGSGEAGRGGAGPADDSDDGLVAYAGCSRSSELGRQWQQPARPAEAGIASPWLPVEWLPCRDGKARPVEPGTFPLAYGVRGRVGRLRGYGNAIVPEVAATFIRAVMSILTE